LEVLTGVVTHIVGPRHITHHEYFFQVHSGTKLPTRMIMKASQNRFQSNETTEKHVQRSYYGEKWKNDSIYFTVDSAAGSTVQEAAYSGPSYSDYPNNSSTCKRKYRSAISPRREQPARPTTSSTKEPSRGFYPEMAVKKALLGVP